ncbi:MAG: hypothetical protein ACRDNZ_00505 [Streptosporangiaceae bacterium]
MIERGSSDAITRARSWPDGWWSDGWVCLGWPGDGGRCAGRRGSVTRWAPVCVWPAVASWSALPVTWSQASTSARENVGLAGLPPAGLGNSG